MSYAFVSLVSSDAYLPGALAQVAALRELHPDPAPSPELPFHTVCLVTPESVDVATIRRLRTAYDHVVGVEILQQDNAAGLKLLGKTRRTCIYARLRTTSQAGQTSQLSLQNFMSSGSLSTKRLYFSMQTSSQYGPCLIYSLLPTNFRLRQMSVGPTYSTQASWSSLQARTSLSS